METYTHPSVAKCPSWLLDYLYILDTEMTEAHWDVVGRHAVALKDKYPDLPFEARAVLVYTGTRVRGNA